MKKTWKIFLFVLAIIPCLFLFSACSITNGKSAYEIAVDNGYEGTVSEWLESLKGANGTNGQDGSNGTDGTNGQDGSNGVDGTNGQDALVDIDEIYNVAVEKGYEGTFFEFLDEYLGNNSITTTQYATAKALRSSVSIYCNFTIENTYTNIWGQTTKSQQDVTSAGSGVVYQLNKSAGDAFIITNYHVVYQYNSISEDKISDDILVFLYGMENVDYKIPASFVGGSMKYDIAVLKISNNTIIRNSDVVAIEIENSNNIAVGQTALAVGNPEAEGISASSGIVSVDSESITMKGVDEVTTVVFRVMRIDTAINSGNSGGGLFNDNGKLIGIVNAKIIDNSIENIAYAIPSNIAIGVAQNLIDSNLANENVHSVQKCMVGFAMIASESKAVWDAEQQTTRIVETISITEVTENTLADGKFFVGDILKSITINGETVETTRVFMAVDTGLKYRVNDTATFVVLRDGVETSISITFTSESVETFE